MPDPTPPNPTQTTLPQNSGGADDPVLDATRGPKPRRLARFTLEIESDTPEELTRAIARALSRVRVGCADWEEETDLTNGTYALDILERSRSSGRRHVMALEAWRKLAAPKKDKRA